ncbi:hypothetical protein ACFL38_02755 [Candidatus Omnitrophota bacterium]
MMQYSHQEKGQAIIITLILLLVSAAVTGAVVLNALTRTKTSEISVATTKATEIAEAGLAAAIREVKEYFLPAPYPNFPSGFPNRGNFDKGIWYDNLFTDVTFPSLPGEQAEGTYSARIKLVYAKNAAGVPVDFDDTSSGGDGDYRYYFEVTAKVPLLNGGDVEQILEGAITYSYTYGTRTLSIDSDKVLGFTHITPERPVIHIDADLPPGKWNLSMVAKLDAHQGPGAKQPQNRPMREDAYFQIGNTKISLLEWVDADGNYQAYDDLGQLQLDEFVVSLNPNLQDSREHRFENISENKVNNLAKQYIFEVPSESELEEPLVFESSCYTGIYVNDPTKFTDACTNDADLDEGAPCDSLCDNIVAQCGEAADYACYRNTCREFCMVPEGFDMSLYDPDAGDFFFQIEHSRSEAKTACDPNTCMNFCINHLQWNLATSQCRQECDGPFGFKSGEYVQPLNWIRCMRGCGESQRIGFLDQCHDLCAPDNQEGCIEYMAGEYQKEANPFNVIEYPNQYFEKPLAQSGSQCMWLCQKAVSDAKCRSECDRRFYRVVNEPGDLFITHANTIPKHEYYRRFVYDKTHFGRNECPDSDCEPKTRGSMNFIDALAEGGAFMLELDSSDIVRLKNPQFKFRP